MFLVSMLKRRVILMLAMSALLSGCAFSRPSGAIPTPIAFSSVPPVEQLIDRINTNTSHVHQLHSEGVRLSMPRQLGSLTATIDFERGEVGAPGRFRLSGTALGTRQLDLGSNDREYWLWFKRNQPPTVFWGRHDQFYQSTAQHILPMPPSWIADAMGLVTLGSDEQHSGYESNTEGLIQIRTRITTPRGDFLRVLEVDYQRALVVQQQIYDEAGRLIAVADSGNFTYDAMNDVSLPRSIKINLPPSGLVFNFEVVSYVVNSPLADPMSTWSMPEIPGHQYLDLANPADMRGVNQMGAGADFYDSQTMVSEPVRPEIPRAAWLRAFNVFR